MNNPTFEMTQGDTSPERIFNCTRTNGEVVNLTGASVVFHIRHPQTKRYTNSTDNSCTIVNAGLGQCSYTWNASDLPVAGVYNCSLVITFQNGTIETQPVAISVLARS